MSIPVSITAIVTPSTSVMAWAASTFALGLIHWLLTVVVVRCHCCGKTARRPRGRTSSGWQYSMSSRRNNSSAISKTLWPVPSGAATKYALEGQARFTQDRQTLIPIFAVTELHEEVLRVEHRLTGLLVHQHATSKTGGWGLVQFLAHLFHGASRPFPASVDFDADFGVAEYGLHLV